MRRTLVTLVSMVFAVVLAYEALAETRVALVVGNGAYAETTQLRNPANDATDISAALEGLGFEVIRVTDGDYLTMRRAFQEFSQLLENAEIGLFFYAGHGLQVSGRNYLVPVNAAIVQERDLFWQAFAVDEFPLQLMETSGARVKLVILDACRDNPLGRSLARSIRAAGRSTDIGRGLAEIRGAAGTLIAYATAPNYVAADGVGRNSPFTAALLEHIAEPGLEVRAMFGRVRAAVLDSTNDQQVPWTSESIVGEFYLRPEQATPKEAAETAAKEPPSPAAEPGPAAFELAYWNSIKDGTDPAMFEAYLKRYPDGEFAEIARLKVEAAKKPREQQTAFVAPPSKIELEPIESGYVAVKNANVREEPTVRSAKVTMLSRGTEVHVAGKVTDRNWYLVERDDKALGYVFGDLLKPPEEARAALTSPTAVKEAGGDKAVTSQVAALPPSAPVARAATDIKPVEIPQQACLADPTPECTLGLSLKLVRELVDQSGRVSGLAELGKVQVEIGDRAAGRARFAEAVRIAKNMPADEDGSTTLNRSYGLRSVAVAQAEAGLRDDAVAAFNDTIKLVRTLPADEYSSAPEVQANQLQYIADSLADLDFTEFARRTYDEAAEIAKTIPANKYNGAKVNQARELNYLADNRAEHGDTAGARQTFRAALQSAWQTPRSEKSVGVWSAWSVLSGIARDQAKSGFIEEGFDTAYAIDDRFWRSSGLAGIAKALADRGEISSSKRTFREALLIGKDNIGALSNIGTAQAQAGFISDAIKTAGQIVSSYRSGLWLDIGRAYLASGDIANAETVEHRLTGSWGQKFWQFLYRDIIIAYAKKGKFAIARSKARQLSDSSDREGALSSIDYAIRDLVDERLKSNDVRSAEQLAVQIQDTDARNQSLWQLVDWYAERGDVGAAAATAARISGGENGPWYQAWAMISLFRAVAKQRPAATP